PALGRGPYDPAADLGWCWEPRYDRFVVARCSGKAAADEVDTQAWAGCDANALSAKGYTFLWVGTVTTVLTSAIRHIVSQANDAVPESLADPGTAPPV
ncbi:MAG: hypothetical protein GY758_26365, partial [Fuerstiella sp.]|nr:hypothetical protein [Fuerstiella sp.]